MIQRRLLHSVLVATALLSFGLKQPAVAESTSQLSRRLESDANCRITDDMIASLQATLEKEPNDASAHLALAICYERLGLPDQAGSAVSTSDQIGTERS